jgi:hypothetical protein
VPLNLNFDAIFIKKIVKSFSRKSQLLENIPTENFTPSISSQKTKLLKFQSISIPVIVGLLDLCPHSGHPSCPSTPRGRKSSKAPSGNPQEILVRIN